MKKKFIHKKGDCPGWYPNKQHLYYPRTCIICWSQKNYETRISSPPTSLPQNLEMHHNKQELEFCIYLGKVLDRTNDKDEKCGCKGYWIHECDIHKLCTINIQRADLQCCARCPDRDVSINFED